MNKEVSSAVTSSIRAKANAVAASLSSPTKTGRAMSKKQQKLAEAAKTSRNISQYFGKKQTAAKSQEEFEEVELHARSPVASETAEMSPVLSEMEGVMTGEKRKTEEQKFDIITIPDEDDVEETHKTQRLENEEVQDTCKESTSE